MRLLHTTSEERFEWTEHSGAKNIPPYAILSHTWEEGQEVTFADLKDLERVVDAEARLKRGYQKLRFCAEQAKQDGLNYFWVDTCCIDKANNTELSEAINSMFRWYQKASKCYVYLSDVESNITESNSNAVSFRQSRWFTRGWTLQELLAPLSVEFFSKDGARLGDKGSLQHIIHEVTKIPTEALSGSNLSDFNVTERFSWAGNRETTREEDSAYCLLGIFGIYMPLIYGEGKDHAMKRLHKKVQEASEDIGGAVIGRTTGKTRNPRQEERLAKICGWLSAPDPSTNYHKAHKQRQADTGLWLLGGEQFTKWKASAASQLWLYGIPGCGKTILSSTVVEHLLESCQDNTSMVTVYFYFDFNDVRKQDPELMLCSLLCQLLQHSNTIQYIDTLFLSCGNGQQRPSVHALLGVIQQTVQEFSQVYFVLDALDECTKRLELMEILEIVAGWRLNNLHLLMTSRRERDIESSLECYLNEEDTVCLQRDVVDRDIQLYVQQRLRNDKRLAKWNKDASIRQEIEVALMGGAQGMFRWAVCQLDSLEKCCNRAMLRKSLATLPRTLDQTYDRMLSAISEEYSNYAMRILQWLTFSERPLTVGEVAEVVAIDVNRDPAFDRDEVLETPLEALEICSSLITIPIREATNQFEEESRSEREEELWLSEQIMTLAHYSVKEYLVSERIKQGAARQYSMEAVECHSSITQGCLKYLLQIQQPLSNEDLEQYALAIYSAKFWSSHLGKTGDKMDQLNQLVIRLMAIDEPVYLTWIQLHNHDRPWGRPDLEMAVEYLAPPLYYAALFGLSTITKLLQDRGADVNAQGGFYGNALQAASVKGHNAVIKLLLDRGADVNAEAGVHGSALQAASAMGHEAIVKMLLDRGANVNAEAGLYSSALQAASAIGHDAIVKLLLDRGADVHVQGGYYGNAVQAALREGNKQLVKLLLVRGGNINAQSEGFGNALYGASYDSDEAFVKLLLDRGTNIDTKDIDCSNALQAASFRGHAAIVKLLLDKNANVNAQGGVYGNALQAASVEGHEAIMKMLLDRGANINGDVRGGYYSTPLETASGRGNEATVKMLLDRGANINVNFQGKYYSTALVAASEGGHEAIVKMLLDRGAQGESYSIALQAASVGGHETIVKMLLDAGAR
ncbi:hypothetical protein ACN47E_009623 [Coniothyrium glycines]